jgi:hypothetical protein
MKLARMVGVVAVAVMALVGGLRAADVSGKWEAEFATPDGQTIKHTFTFKVDGEKLTGSVLSSMAGTEAAIENGSVKGDVLDFWVTRDFQGNSVKFHYKGTVKGEEIPLKLSADMGGQAFELDMTAKRVKS